MSRWPEVALEAVLRKSDDWIALDPEAEYREVTVRNRGKGAVLRRIVTGAEIASSRRLRVHARQFIISRIDARHGSSAVIPADLEGAVVTNDFPVFDCDDKRLLPEYLGWYCKTGPFVDACVAASEGSTNRVRLKEPAFLQIEMPLPPVEEQQRVVRRIEQLATRIQAIRSTHASAARTRCAWVESSWANMIPEAGGQTVGDCAKVQSGYAFKSEWFQPSGIRLVRNVNVGHGELDWGQTVCVSEERCPEFERFELQAGDVLVSLDRPIISTGVKVALVREADVPSLLLQRVGRFLITDPELDPQYLFLWLQSPRFSRAIDPGRSNGVPHISPKDVERIPFSRPSLDRQRTIVKEVGRLSEAGRTLDLLEASITREAEVLMAGLLRRSFRLSGLPEPAAV